jgi:hypothetical protein
MLFDRLIVPHGQGLPFSPLKGDFPNPNNTEVSNQCPIKQRKVKSNRTFSLSGVMISASKVPDDETSPNLAEKLPGGGTCCPTTEIR